MRKLRSPGRPSEGIPLTGVGGGVDKTAGWWNLFDEEELGVGSYEPEEVKVWGLTWWLLLLN